MKKLLSALLLSFFILSKITIVHEIDTPADTPADTSADTPVDEQVEFPETETYYTDNEVDVTFTVPAGWKNAELPKEGKRVQTGYFDQNDNLLLFVYVDIWPSISEADKQGLNRCDVNNDFYTKSQILELYSINGAEDTNVEYVTINNIKYFKITYQIKDDDVNQIVVGHMLLDNGIMYVFYLMGETPDYNTYKQYDELLSSIKFEHLSTNSSPVNETTETYNPVNETTDTYNPVNSADKPSARTVFRIIRYIVYIFALPMIIYKFMKKNE